MKFNLLSLSSLMILVLSIPAGLFVFNKTANKEIKYPWLSFSFLIAFWGFCGFKISSTSLKEEAIYWWQLGNIAIILMPPVFFHFFSNYLKIKQVKNVFLWYLLSAIFLYINFVYPKSFIGDLRYVNNQFYWINWSQQNYLHLVFFITFWCGLLLSTFVSMMIKRLYSSTGQEKNQLKYFMLGALFSWLGGAGNFLTCLGTSACLVTNFFVIVYPFFIGYAIVRYRLMDISVVITRTGVFIAVYTLVLGLPFILATTFKKYLVEIFGGNWWMLPLILMALLATTGPFIFIYIQRKAENRLLKEQRRYQETLKHASLGMTRIRNLRKLLDLIAHIVTKTVRISYAGIYLHDRHTNECVLQVSRPGGRVAISKIAMDNPLIDWLISNREPLIYEEVKRITEDTGDIDYCSLEESMRALDASLVIPSFLEDKFMGFFVLGDKKSGEIYTLDDLNVFEVLASQAALAIENAQFYEETKEMHAQIAQAEKMATIGTMADGLSHQINNRFYALSLIAGDSIDTIKLTDTSKCSPEIKDMINNINYALGRIQSNVIQGGDVVRGLLKYSRKGDEGLEALKLNDIIDNTLEMVQFKVKLSEIDLIRDFPQDLPKLKGNMTQLNEAFFNFIDNAYDAIVERRTTLKEPGYRGKITISAKPIDDYLQIVIQDNGMGIKDDNNKKVFTPFFTTKTSSRKGTGLGLYVIRRIIIESHHGKIAFESEDQVGTRFTLELPLAK